MAHYFFAVVTNAPITYYGTVCIVLFGLMWSIVMELKQELKEYLLGFPQEYWLVPCSYSSRYNKVNKSLVALIEELGVKACGISGKDGGMLKVEKKLSGGEDIGYVGEVKDVDTTIITSLLKDDFIPVICPIGYDDTTRFDTKFFYKCNKTLIYLI